MNSQLLSLNQAAKAVGKSPSTISKYLNNGKLSYISKDDDGYKIDPSELYRVFPAKKENTIRENKNGRSRNPEKMGEYIEIMAENKILLERLKDREREITKLEQRTGDLQSERDDWKKQAQQLLLQAPQKPVEPPKRFLGIFSRKSS